MDVREDSKEAQSLPISPPGRKHVLVDEKRERKDEESKKEPGRLVHTVEHKWVE